jgi:hypothetical protein
MIITKCDMVAFIFVVLISMLEAWALFTCFEIHHQHVVNYGRILIQTLMFNGAIALFIVKYKAIKDSIKRG